QGRRNGFASAGKYRRRIGLKAAAGKLSDLFQQCLVRSVVGKLGFGTIQSGFRERSQFLGWAHAEQSLTLSDRQASLKRAGRNFLDENRLLESAGTEGVDVGNLV